MAATLKMYGDESSDATKKYVFAVAGLIAEEAAWQDAERSWTACTGGAPVHANEIEHEYADDPDPQKHKDALALYRELIQAITRSALVGWSVALDLDSLAVVMPGLLPDMAYYKCLLDVIGAAGRTAEGFNLLPTEPDRVRLEFTFDSRKESDGTAGSIYTVFRTLPEWADIKCFDTKISFEGGYSPRLEMADFFAREGMKELERKIAQRRPQPRRSWAALNGAYAGSIKRFHFLERDRAYIEGWRTRVNSQAEQFRPEYKQWLLDTGRVQNGVKHDNLTNRFCYLSWLDRRGNL